MEAIEFYTLDDELWYRTAEGTNTRLTENDTELIQKLLLDISERYPEAYKALQKEYQKSAANVRYYQFLMVRRFCKCNFGKFDTAKTDVCGNFNFEKVDCPLRGECKYECVICNPKFNANLSVAELRVMKLVYEGLGKDEISERLFISPNTIKNHVRSVYAKLGIHEKSEFVKYVKENDLFNNI